MISPFTEGQDRSVRLLGAVILSFFILLSLACSGCLYEPEEAKAAPAPSPRNARAPRWPLGVWYLQNKNFPTTLEFRTGGVAVERWHTTEYHYRWKLGGRGSIEVWTDGGNAAWLLRPGRDGTLLTCYPYRDAVFSTGGFQ